MSMFLNLSFKFNNEKQLNIQEVHSADFESNTWIEEQHNPSLFTKLVLCICM